MKATKLPSGNYRVRVYIGESGGKKKFVSITDKSRNEALRKAALLKRDIADGAFSTQLEQYISIKTPILSPASIRGYRNIQRVLLKNYPRFCHKEVRSITSADVQAIINDMVTKGYSPKTVRNYNGLISAITKVKVSLPRKDDREIVLPTEEDVKRIIIATYDTPLEIPVLLASYRGLRRGEVCGLRWSDFDFENGTLHIQRDIVLGPDRKWHTKPPKTRAGDRYVPIPKDVLDRIQELGRLPEMDPGSLGKRFHHLMKKLGMAYHFHSMRHFATSYLHSVGIPDAVLMAWFGWDSDVVLKQIYRHAMDDQSKAFAALADEKMRLRDSDPPQKTG